MSRKAIAATIFTLLLMLAIYPPSASAKQIPNVNCLIVASEGEPESSDPAWAYDTDSAEMIFNVYETLIFPPWERAPSDPMDFEPMLASSWTVSEDGRTYTFFIRPNVPYHNPAYGTVKPVDVEYSIERAMVFDHIGGPQWMLYDPLLGILGSYSIDLGNPTEVAALGAAIDDAVQVGNATHVGTGYPGMPNYVPNADRVIFNLAMPYAPFIQILTQSWCSVYPQAWGEYLSSATPGDGEERFVWPGWTYTGTTSNPYTAWIDFNDNLYSQLEAPFDSPTTVMMGTGPFKFQWWIKGGVYILERFNGYWKSGSGPDPSSSGRFDLFIVKYVPSLLVRIAMLLSNNPQWQADVADVPAITAPGVRVVQISAVTCHVERDWVQGWYYNPMYPGLYVYRMWKGLDADITGDGKVDLDDGTQINVYFYDSIETPPGSGIWTIIKGPSGVWNRKADICSPFLVNGEPRTWELDGTLITWRHYGTLPGYEIPGVDGLVNIYDGALVSAQIFDYVVPY